MGEVGEGWEVEMVEVGLVGEGLQLYILSV